MPGPDPVTEVTREWLRRAQVDLSTARVLIASREGLEPWVASYHAQQAAEKYIKAALVFEQVLFPHTHELERLVPLLRTEWHLPDAKTLAGMSRFAVIGRYPGGMTDMETDPSWPDAEEAVELAADVQRAILDGIRTRGMDPTDNREVRDGS